MLVDVEGGDGCILLVHIPQLHRHVVAGQDVSSIGAEGDVRDAGNDLAEKGLVGLRLHLLKSLGMAVAEGSSSHVGEPDAALAAAICEYVAVGRMELSTSDHLNEISREIQGWLQCFKGNDSHLSEVLHIRGLNVHNVEALLSHIEAPKIDPQVIR